MTNVQRINMKKVLQSVAAALCIGMMLSVWSPIAAYAYKPGTSSAAQSTQSGVTALDEAGAKDLFEQTFPGVTVIKVKLEGGKKYYLYGENGNRACEMTVLIAGGRVVNTNEWQIRGSSSNSGSDSSNSDSGSESGSSTYIDEAGAKDIFEQTFPGVPVLKVKLEDGGKVYYLYGEQNRAQYKLKIRVSDGSILYSYASGNKSYGGR